MPRSLDLTLPAENTPRVLDALRESGLPITLSIQRAAVEVPAGARDLITVRTTNDDLGAVIRLLHERGLSNGATLATADVHSIVSPPDDARLRRESSEATWTEMAFFIRHESNISANYILFMFLAGGVATVGLWKNAPHIVVGAMLIAPAMLPLLRIPFGIVGHDRQLALRGIASTAAGYFAIILGAILTALVLRAVDPVSHDLFRSYAWVQHWSSLSPSAIVVAMLAAAAGAVAVAGLRLVPLAGVLIALDLVPATAMIGISLAFGNVAFSAQNFGRAAVDAAIVLVVSGLVLWAKRRLIHRAE